MALPPVNPQTSLTDQTSQTTSTNFAQQFAGLDKSGVQPAYVLAVVAVALAAGFFLAGGRK